VIERTNPFDGPDNVAPGSFATISLVGYL